MAGLVGLTCGSCGAEVAEGSRFCASCGQPLVIRGDERRIVTVLFADLVGFTSMAEGRDPEQVKNLVDRCFERLAADVSAFGGRVDKVMGDAILAIFGAPVAHEDDADRAVRAGLQMQQTLTQWSEEVGAGGLRLRVGVNTGEVLVGGMRAAGDWTAMGDTVNTANRLQAIAAPGSVVVGPDTHAATCDAIRYTALGEVEAKGRTALVAAYVAEETTAPPGRRARRSDVPLVGRSHERSSLDSLVDAAVRRRRATTILVVGEAGMGKSRLVEEVAARAEAEHGAIVFEGACVPYGEANVLWPVADSLRAAMGVPVGTAADRTRVTVRSFVAEAVPNQPDEEVDRVTEGLLQLLGEPSALEDIDPSRAREEATRALIALIDGWASQRPVVITISDLHWADDALLQLGDALTERSSNLPFVLLATARAGVLERWRPPLERTTQVVLHLDPLDRDAAEELLDHLLCDVPDELRQLVLDRSGGNPFFLEELSRLLAEGGGRTTVPHTLRGLVAARLDALSSAEREVIDNASILGRKFPRMAVELMTMKGTGATSAEVGRVLDDLVAKDLLACDGDDHLFRFRSDLVREVAYGTLTKAARVKGHFGVADWIERHPTGKAVDRDRVAHHYATAATLVGEVGEVDGVPADLPQRASAALIAAIGAAGAHELHVTVKRLATLGLELPRAALDPATEVRFRLARAKASAGLRKLDEADSDLAAARTVAAGMDDAVVAAQVVAGQAEVEQKRGDIEGAINLYEEAVGVFRHAGAVRLVADALLGLGMTHIFAGDDEQAGAAFGEALIAFRELGDRRGEGWAVQNLAWVAFSGGRVDAADAHCAASLAIFEELGDRGGKAWALGLQAYVRYHQGRFAEAEALADRVLDEAEGRDDPWAIGMMLALRGSLRLWTGRSASAIGPTELALERFEAMGDWYGQLLALGVLGRSLVSQGRIEEGFERIDQAAAVAATTTSTAAPLMATVHLVTAAAQAGRPDRVGVIEMPELEELDRPEIGFTDCSVGEALLHLQRGDGPGGAAALEGLATALGERSSGYVLSALALARAAQGDVAGVAEAAARAAKASSATYSDQVLASTALALAAARAGDSGAVDQHLADARAALEPTDDRHSRNLLALAAATAQQALGRPVSPGAGQEGATASPGWAVAYRVAAGLGETGGNRDGGDGSAH